MEKCEVKKCEKMAHARGLCGKHYMQKRRHNTIKNRTIFDPNEIIIKENIAEIVLYGKDGQEKCRSIIDLEDVKKINGYKWSVSIGRKNKPSKVVTHKKGTKGMLLIHRLIMGLSYGRKPLVDHINGNVLDNRKANLRVCNNAENIRNQEREESLSGYKGIKKRGNSWGSRIMENGKEKWLGSFNNKEDAIKTYNNASIQYFGEFAKPVEI